MAQTLERMCKSASTTSPHQERSDVVLPHQDAIAGPVEDELHAVICDAHNSCAFQSVNQVSQDIVT
jgi:hypothetical protein